MTSEQLFHRAKATIPGGVNSPVRAFRSVGGTPFFTQRADGCHLTTVDGRQLIDFVCTWGPAIHGHNHPAIAEALHEAIDRGTSFGTPGPAEVDMAELIVKHVPSVEKVRMVNSGTEATMSAIRLARGFTGREKIIKFAGCYHGHVDALLVQAGSGALTFGAPDSAGVTRGAVADTLVLPYNSVPALQACFAEHGESIAAVILEPYPANVGLLLPRRNYLQKLRDLCTAYGTLLIFDEVMTGFRIGLGGVQEKEGIMPDLTALGKIIGGGLPVGAFGGRADIMDYLSPLGPVYQAGTLSGNPLAMAAGIASIRLLEETDPYWSLNRMGHAIQASVRVAAEEKGLPLEIPRAGSMFSFFFSELPVYDFEQALASNSRLYKKIFHYALEHGVYLPPSPFETCFISSAHDNDAIDRTTEVLTGAILSL